RLVISTGDLDARLQGARRTTSIDKPSASPPAEMPSDKRHEPIARIWRDVLGIDDNAAGIHDDFFDLGGDSFQAIALVDRLKQEPGLEVPVHELFSCSTIAKLQARWSQQSSRANLSTATARPETNAAAAAPLLGDQFAAGVGASVDDRKRRMQEF